MNKLEVQEYLYENIPLTKLMKIEIEEYSEKEVALSSPLSINRNHKGTAFGGSLVTILTTNCWLMAFRHFKDIDPSCHIVIAKSEVDYLRPVTKDFVSKCQITDFDEVGKAIEYYKRKGKTRLNLVATISENDKICVEFRSTFVVFKDKE